MLCLVGTLAALGLRDLNQSPLHVSDIRPFNLSPRGYALSGDQSDTIAAMGYPDSFIILFYDDDFGGESTRLETWIYSSLGQKITFVSGQRESSETFESLDGEILAAPYTPEQFSAYMSLEEVVATTEIDEFLLLPLERELVPGGESYFGDRLAFGLKDDQLLYVEAIGFEAVEGATVAEAGGDAEPPDGQPPAPTAAPTAAPPNPTAAPPNPTSAPTVEPPPAVAVGDPLVYVSQRDDPDWPDCEDSDAGCQTDIFVMYPDADDTIDTNLTAGLGFDYVSTPALSHDGTRIAFEGARGGRSGLYTIEVDGSHLTQVTDPVGFDWSPAWSPDDDRIAFVSDREGENRWNLFIVDLSSGDIEQITTGQIMDRFVDWSPSGDLLAFNSDRADPNSVTCFPDCEWNLYMLRLDDRAVQAMPEEIGQGAGGITWSPDGTQMAFHAPRDGQYDLFLIDADLNVTRLSNTAADEVHPAWSPDGTRLAFSTNGGGNWDIAITPITEFDPLWYTGVGASDYYPDW